MSRWMSRRAIIGYKASALKTFKSFRGFTQLWLLGEAEGGKGWCCRPCLEMFIEINTDVKWSK